MSESFVPKTRLAKILCGVETTAKTHIEKAVAVAIDSLVGLPKVTSSDNGKVLLVKSGKWQKGRASDCAPLEASGVMSKNGEDKEVITLNKTAEELFAAAQSGRYVKVTTEVTIGTEPNVVTAEAITIGPINASMLTSGDYVAYSFALITAENSVFRAENIAANATVVLTEV